MKNFKLHYQMSLTFSHPIEQHYFKLKCIPRDEAWQQATNMKVYVSADYFNYSEDGFNNRVLYGQKWNTHQDIKVVVDADVHVDSTKLDKNEKLVALYRIATKRTDVGESLGAWKDSIVFKEGMSDSEKTLFVMQSIHDAMSYVKGVTDLHTSAEAAFLKKEGVCQDYAQIMIAVLRSYGFPCRYVAGVMEHEALTHAWVEVFFDRGWHGYDPTNLKLVDDSYVVFAHGRDAHDVYVNSGVFLGNDITQKQDIQITLEEKTHE